MIHLISDTHFNHKKMVEYCARPVDFDDRIKKGLEILTAEDTLIHLGDICIGNDLEIHQSVITPLPCKKILIRGNHDKKTKTWYLRNGWDEVKDFEMILIGNTRLFFTHEPKEDLDSWSWNIHGHCHNKPPLKEECPWYSERHFLFSLEGMEDISGISYAYEPIPLFMFTDGFMCETGSKRRCLIASRSVS